MLTINVTEDELNTILHGLYLLEDQKWFYGKDISDKLITRLNTLVTKVSKTKGVICDI